MNVVREGRSFSGRESNCLFLNNGQTFVNASAASGFDYADDGRGLAIVDWDQDGWPDVWTSNRNAPQLRLLRNQIAPREDRHSLTIRLKGVMSNRDAIGARVVVRLEDQQLPLTRTLRAGCAYLSQSSKELHFGLGQDSRVESCVVHWPSGQTQTFTLPKVDCCYELTEGDSTATIIPRRKTTSRGMVRMANRGRQTDGSQQQTATSSSHAMCFSMVRLPVSDFVDYQDRIQPIVAPQPQVTLLTLWASWCQPCLADLSEIASNESILRKQGFDCVALAVDPVDSKVSDKDQSESVLRRLRYPFRAGRADAATIEKLQLLHDTIFELRNPLPVPTSFLLDRSRRVVAVYQGSVSVAKLIDDRQKMSAKSTLEWRMSTVPFPGRWQMPPRRLHLFDFVEALVARGYRVDALDYVRHNEKMFKTHPRWSQLQKRLYSTTASEGT